MIQGDLQPGASEVVEARFPVEVGGWFDLHVVSHTSNETSQSETMGKERIQEKGLTLSKS
jgi:hypothetical protein